MDGLHFVVTRTIASDQYHKQQDPASIYDIVLGNAQIARMIRYNLRLLWGNHGLFLCEIGAQ